jgi:GntR family transcriptional regulator
VTADLDDNRLAYLQVAAALREQIRSGQLEPGENVGTNKELADRYRVAAMTVRSALDVLRGEGLIVSQRGRGTFVAPNADKSGTERTPDVLAQVAQLSERVEELTRRVSTLEQHGSSSDSHVPDDA